MKNTLHKLLLLGLAVTVAADFSSLCPDKCRCFWKNGNKVADCSEANFNQIPKGLSTEIQILNLTGNNLSELTRDSFDEVPNLKSLLLKDCKLTSIHRDALQRLSIMIQLDLTNNNLMTLDPETFKGTSNLRLILLKDNKLEKLVNGLFNDLPHLREVDLSNNHIHEIGVTTFINAPQLTKLNLENNRLEHLQIETLNDLTLSVLGLTNNPWRCDCNLKPFRDWVIGRHLYTVPLECIEPAHHRSKNWDSLDSDDFTCRPSVAYPSTLRLAGPNITLTCKVHGNPLPEVKLHFGSRLIEKSHRYQGRVKYYVTDSNVGYDRLVNVTIVNAGADDNGEYVCEAKNSGGEEQRTFTLEVDLYNDDYVKNVEKDVL